MNNCLLCQRTLNQPVSIGWLLGFQPTNKSIICDKCQNDFAKLPTSEVCDSCNKANVAATICGDCKDWNRQMEFPFINRSLYQYNAAMKAFMHRYKFVGDYRLRQIFIEAFSQLVQNQHRLVVPIPLHPATLKKRAFNQTIGLLNNIELVEALSTIHNEKQVDQSKRTRNQRKMIEQPFCIVETLRPFLLNQDIVIVDDVYTTGTTIRLAAQLLMNVGAKSVTGVTLAR
ncbi:ComF family protein [Lactobacillaceae bacterium Scapto_B20]